MDPLGGGQRGAHGTDLQLPEGIAAASVYHSQAPETALPLSPARRLNSRRPVLLTPPTARCYSVSAAQLSDVMSLDLQRRGSIHMPKTPIKAGLLALLQEAHAVQQEL